MKPSHIYLIASAVVFVGHSTASVSAPTFTRIDAFPPPFGSTQGSAWADYDGDGDVDLFVASGNVFSPTAQSNLYENRGDGSFERVVSGPIVEDAMAAFSGAWGDFDGDQDLDLLVAASVGTDFNVEAIASPRIYRNDGFGQFSRYVPDAFRSDLQALTAATVWGDFDRDGDLDAYVGNDWGPNLSGIGVPNHLFRNDGHGIFTAVADPSTGTTQQTLAVAASDFDDDNDLDLFVANGGAGAPGYADDRLYINDGQGGFTPVTDSDVVRSDGWTVTSAWLDYDNDGDSDLFAANVFTPHFLFRNDGAGGLTRVTEGALVTDVGAQPRLGVSWGDLDNDGDLDAFVNGSFDDAHYFYLNDGEGNFTRVESGIRSVFVGSSSAADHDLDGDLDLFVGDGGFGDGPSYLLVNGGSENAWVNIQPRGRASNTTGIGAKIRVTATIRGKRTTQLREIVQQSNWGGHGPLTAHVGLGDAKSIHDVRIEWPSGGVDVERRVRANEYYVAIEGRGLVLLTEDLLARLSERVAAFERDKTLGRVHGVTLRAALAVALKLVRLGHERAAEAIVTGFINEVGRLADRDKLDDREAHWLLDPAATVKKLIK